MLAASRTFGEIDRLQRHQQRSNIEPHNLGCATTGPQRKLRQGHRQFEPSRSGAAGVNKENSAALFDLRLVRVTIYDRVQGIIRIEVEFREVVKNVDHVPAELNKVVCGKTAGPSPSVIIPTNRPDWRDSSERLQNCWVTDIAAMNDEIRVLERL